MRDDLERLRDILKTINQIRNKTVGGRSAFSNDEMVWVWILHHLQIIGVRARFGLPRVTYRESSR